MIFLNCYTSSFKVISFIRLLIIDSLFIILAKDLLYVSFEALLSQVLVLDRRILNHSASKYWCAKKTCLVI